MSSGNGDAARQAQNENGKRQKRNADNEYDQKRQVVQPLT